MSMLIPLVVSGLTLGCVYAAIAIGFVLIFKAASILNFAQGDFVMLAIYLGILAFSTMGLPVVIAFLFVVAAMGAFGLVVHYGVAKPLIGKPFFSLVLATIGVGLMIRAGVISYFGVHEMRPLAIFPRGGMRLGGAYVSYTDLWIIAITVLTVVLFTGLFKWTSVGLRMRAVADNLEAATIVGINTNTVFATTWVVGLAVTAVGGILFAAFTSSIDLSVADIGLHAIPAAIIGGMTSLPGAIFGGILLGLLEQVGSGYLGAEWRNFVAFGTLFVVLILRPQGVFGKAEVERV